MALDGISNVEDIQGVSNDEGQNVPIANDGTYSAYVEGEPIDSTGTLIELDTRGKRVLDLAVDGTATADYALEASPDGTNWFGPFDEFKDAETIAQAYRIGSRYVRIRVTGTASDDSTAKGFMEAS
jgi:hypothetical protein